MMTKSAARLTSNVPGPFGGRIDQGQGHTPPLGGRNSLDQLVVIVGDNIGRILVSSLSLILAESRLPGCAVYFTKGPRGVAGPVVNKLLKPRGASCSLPRGADPLLHFYSRPCESAS